MTPELFNRIHDELKEYLKRDPKIDEVINAQKDYVIMAQVNDRIRNEENAILQDQIDDLKTQMITVNTSVNSLTKKSVG